MTSSKIIITQTEYESLLKEIAVLKERISTLTALRDDLIYHICPALRSEYEEKIAGLERKLYAARLYLREKQRIIEILQAQMNRNQKPSMDEARQEAGEEFRQFKEDLNRKAKEAEDFQDHWKKDADWYKHDKADRKSRESGNSGEKDGDSRGKAGDASGQESGTQSHATDADNRIGQDANKDGYKNAHKEGHETNHETSEGEQDDKEQKTSPVEEIKRLYRKIVKLLHPDVHPNPTERERDLLNRANDANAWGDLEEMRAIWEEVSGMHVKEEEYTDTPDDIARMKELIEALKNRCRELEQEIRHIKSQYPYTMKAFLDDEAAVEEKRNSLKDQIDQTREMDRKLADYIEELRKKMGNN